MAGHFVVGGWGLNKEFYKSRLFLIVLILFGILAVLTLYFVNQYYLSDDFRPGASIASIPVAGVNQEEAKSLLNQQLDRINNMPVSFVYQNAGDKTILAALIQPVNLNNVVISAWTEDQSQTWYQTLTNLIIRRNVNYPLPLEYNSIATDALLQKWNAQWAVPFREAALEMDKNKGLIVTPGQVGIKVNAEKTYKILPVQMAAIPASISGSIVMDQKYPKVDEETLRNMGEIDSFTTKYKVSEVNRTHNLTIATNVINGSIIRPGEIFSFNQTVGQRTMESGYKDAMVIVGGKFVPGLGGGICQVSSTLYNACLLAGLQIVERSNHNLTVVYVPLGQDATVAYGIQDFKFKNNTTSPIYVRTVAGGGYLTVNIYGDLTFKKKIVISNIIDQTIAFQTVTQVDPTLKAGEQKVDHNGQNGYVVRSFRTYYDSSGEKIKTEALGRSTYRPLNKTILTGPAEAIEPPVKENPNNPPAEGEIPTPPPVDGPVQPPVENQGPLVNNSNPPL